MAAISCRRADKGSWCFSFVMGSKNDEDEDEPSAQACADGGEVFAKFGVHGSEQDQEDDAEGGERCADSGESFVSLGVGCGGSCHDL